MREIKFRAWDKDEGGYRDHENLMSHVYAKKGFDVFNDPDYIIEQFTGLRDKDGREIYEGDIYKSTYRAGSAGSVRGQRAERVRQVVEWNDRGHWGRRRIEAGRGYSCCHPDCELGEKVEVIGNIHENPELLKP